MKMILIGHRGVGKTSLLQRLATYQNLLGQKTPTFDLDREIELETHLSTEQIFESRGELQFRELELKKFRELTQGKEFIISVGAGFLMKKIKNENPDLFQQLEVVWVRRPSDSVGRIFLDRPRLDLEVDPLQEYLARYGARTTHFRELATWTYDLPEGLNALSDFERQIFFGPINELAGGITLLPTHAQNYESFKSREWRWDLDFFELRDDLLTDEELEKFFVLLAPSQTLISFRRATPSALFLQALEEGYRADWPLELPASEWTGAAQVLSVHERLESESLTETILRLEKCSKPHQSLKLAVLIDNYSELATALKWQAQDPSRRNFLPRSKDGRWSWVRRWLKDRQSINFLRQGDGSSLDQPTIFEWMASPARPLQFAAVLGEPIFHSYSPVEQGDFFRRRQMPYFAISISTQEWGVAFPLLETMGLVAASVTAPLKSQAFEFSKQGTTLARELKSVNTLGKARQEWVSQNTDYSGFEFVLSTLPELGPCVLWGGGGTLAVLKKLIPHAQAYSARTGAPRPNEMALDPRTLIWAASPTSESPWSRLHKDWKPEIVIDLNYREDSRAKEYCQIVGARYISGLPMFKAQAQAQREFWQRIWLEGPHDSE
jgi:shikimate 5-dehydrogenase/shikimate kinase